ncbi:hypothetical protein [Snuella lapsa]|uniref:ATP synthase F0 subunit 8 n=1 Tax=Snuella lapsa TaxID=870481 RepID=A0ABP6XTN8_9FLAO
MNICFLYFDPGLGAMVVQAIVAAIAGIVLFSKKLMYKVKSFFGIVKRDSLFYDINVKDSDVKSKDVRDK